MNAEIICGGLTFENAPVTLREKIAFQENQLPEALRMMRSVLGLQEAVLVSTCNRVEYFGATVEPMKAAQAWPDFLRQFHAVHDDFGPLTFQLSGETCVEHLFSVAAGLKSMVVGETEILGQIKQAYSLAHLNGQTGKWMNRLFQSSFAAAKAVRSRTGITRGSVSVGSVAVELAEKIFGDLPSRQVMIIGAGETSEKTARALRRQGVRSLIVANRTLARAQNLAQELGGEAVNWENWESRVSQMDIVISSTSAPHYLLTVEKLEALRRKHGQRPLFLIDLAVPRDFEPAINLLDSVYLYDIDDLQSIAQTHLKERRAEIIHSTEILKPHVKKYLSWASRQLRTGSSDLRSNL